MRKSYWVIVSVFIGVLLTAPVLAQEEVEFSTESPYHTVLAHLYFLQPDSYNPSKAANTLFRLEGEHDAEQLAIMLKQILDGRGLFVNLEELPRDPAYLDSASNQHRYILFPQHPRVFLEKYGEEWLYSRATVEMIPQMHREVFILGSEKLVEIMPEPLLQPVFGIQLWQYLGILALLLLCFLMHKVFTFFIDGLIAKSIFRRGKTNVAHGQILQVARPVSIFIIFWLLQVFVPILQLPAQLNQYAMLSLKVVNYLFVIVIFYRLVDLVAEYYNLITKKETGPLDNQVVPLIRKAVKLVIVIMGTLVILQNLDFNITALLAGLSIGGLAFALAAQDTIKNLFGSILIFSDRPFKVGDWISFDGKDGTVEEVGIRSTRIRTFYNSLIYIPNGRLADMAVDNYGMRQYRRFYTKLAITYDTPPELIEVFVDGLKEIVAHHPHTRKDYYEIHLNDLGSHSLDVMFYIFFEVPNWSGELRGRHEVLIAVLKLAEKLNVRFAFPTNTLHMETFPEKDSLTPEYVQTEEDFRKQSKEFINDWKLRQGIPVKPVKLEN